MQNGKNGSETESEDDVPLSSLVKTEPLDAIVKTEVSENNIKREQTRNPEPISESDSDDELPIVKLKKGPKEKPSSVKTSPPKKKIKVEKKTSNSKKKAIKIKYKQQESSEALYDTAKGRLVQELLCRWWYAIEWPPKDLEYDVPNGCQELDGFKGSFIVVKGEDMGSISDMRSNVGKPSFVNLFAKTAEELQELLVRAYKAQMEELIRHEGETAPLLSELKKSLKYVVGVNTKKAEKEASKVLRSFNALREQLDSLRE